MRRFLGITFTDARRDPPSAFRCQQVFPLRSSCDYDIIFSVKMQVCRTSCIRSAPFHLYSPLYIRMHEYPTVFSFCGQAVDEFRKNPQKARCCTFSLVHSGFIHRLWMLWKHFGGWWPLFSFGAQKEKKICILCMRHRQESDMRKSNIPKRVSLSTPRWINRPVFHRVIPRAKGLKIAMLRRFSTASTPPVSTTILIILLSKLTERMIPCNSP